MTTNSDAPKKKNIPAIPIALTLLTLALIFYVVWRVDTAPGTDDAYVYADTIDVVSEVSGKIINLPIHDNQAVKEGDLLFEIDPRPYENGLKAARAALVQLDKEIELAQRGVDAQKYAASAVEASLERARAAAQMATDTLQRMEPLLADGYVSAEAVDQARTAQRSAQAVLDAELLRSKEAASAVRSVDGLVAQRAVMEAQIAIAELNLEFTKVYAPFDGRVVSLDISEGQFASPLKPVCTLIDTRNWFVVANFREAELKHIYPGTHSTVYLMANSDILFQGTVDSIGFGVHPDDGGSTLGGLPKVKRSINWVRVAQRFPVKILIENPDPDLFRIGASAVVTINTSFSKHGRKLARNTKSTLPEEAVGNNIPEAAAVIDMDKQEQGTNAGLPEVAVDNNTPEAAAVNDMDKQEQAMRVALARSEDPAVKREMEVLSITFKGDVSFDVNSSSLKPEILDEIKRVADVLNQYPQTTILVAGYTDSTGAEDHNRKLSEHRAESVKYALVSYGVSPMRVSTMGYGEDNSISSNDTSEGRQLNRRVEIHIQPRQGA